MMESEFRSFSSAISDFNAARNRAALGEILARFTGANTRLLSFDEVREKLKLQGGTSRGLQDIPLDAIVGSLGRYSDFNRSFLPLEQVDRERWARVKVAVTGQIGLPPIDVYKIGEVYFVKDGNHRVSVAREMGARYIQAYVTELRTRVPLTPDLQPDDLILKAEYADFLEKTRLDILRPNSDLSMTVPGKYSILLEHIDVHRYFMGIDFQRDISYEEAVAHWYDTVYLPVVQVIRARGFLHAFPERTETDLYLWLAEHRAALEKELGWDVDPAAAASDLAEQYGTNREGGITRLGERFLNTVALNRMEPGPEPGEWRREKQASQREDRLFHDILVAVSGQPPGWLAVEQALLVAQREGARLHGLNVVTTEKEKESPENQAIREEFKRRCAQAGVKGDLTFSEGEVAQQVCTLSRWTDLVITSLTYPPGPQPLARLSSGLRDLLARCPRPVMAAPQVSPLDRPLLAYDGSPKAKEALYVATYLSGKWSLPLVVISVGNGNVSPRTLEEARDYLKGHGIEASYVQANGPVVEAIRDTCEERGCDFLVMGGYGYTPVLEVVLGSTVDQVLRECHKPVLICR